VELMLNWIWQGGIVAVATAGVLRAISPAQTVARYWAAWAGCAAVLALPFLSLARSAASDALGAAPASAPIVSLPVQWWTSTTIALAAWMLWIVIQTVRVTLAAAALRQVKGACRAFPSRVEARLVHWSRLRAAGRRARLVLSDHVGAAAVLGGSSPLIAVAPRLLDDLGDSDLDRIVVHEWAHVQRHDDAAQAVQLLVRIVAGWHPAIWWLERQLHLEREIACDETAVAATGSAKDYAACLAALAAGPAGAMRRLPVMAAASPPGLRRRVIRILAVRRVSTRGWRATAAVSAVSLGAIAFGVASLRVVATTLASSDVAGVFAMDAARVFAQSGSLPAPTIPSAGSATPARIHATAQRPPAFNTLDADPLPPGNQMVPAVPDTGPDDPPLPAGTIPPLGAPAAPPSGTASMDSGGPATAPGDGRPIWSAAADAGMAVGRRSENAASATAGFFVRFGKTVGNSF
jgi:beta-lactamase regulating signal transducer with metallopeptidase domain